MRLKPVSHYATPGLPTRDFVDANPDLLRLLPRRWQGNTAVITALTACLAMASCGKSQSSAPSRVAPIFVHGAGIGAFGCMVVSPPVFLSEDEAQAVIRDEAKNAGLNFHMDTTITAKVEIPISSWEWADKADGIRLSPKTTDRARNIVLDAIDEKHNVAIEFVSKRDLPEMLGDTNYPGQSAGSDNVKRAAENFSKALAQSTTTRTYGVFYDPVTGWDTATDRSGYKPDWGATAADSAKEERKLNAMAKDVSREELRAQVKDFIKWLKAQGVI